MKQIGKKKRRKCGNMTREDINNIISIICPNDEDFEKPIISPAYLKKELEALALEQEPCEDAISREATLKPYNGLNDEDTISVWLIRKNIEQQPPVAPQPKTGCEGCVYEKTGNNSTYPCSYCGRCYTDKYKAGSKS